MGWNPAPLQGSGWFSIHLLLAMNPLLTPALFFAVKFRIVSLDKDLVASDKKVREGLRTGGGGLVLLSEWGSASGNPAPAN